MSKQHALLPGPAESTYVPSAPPSTPPMAPPSYDEAMAQASAAYTPMPGSLAIPVHQIATPHGMPMPQPAPMAQPMPSYPPRSTTQPSPISYPFQGSFKVLCFILLYFHFVYVFSLSQACNYTPFYLKKKNSVCSIFIQ